MTMQRLLAAVTGVILGMVTLAGGPAALVGHGIPTAMAQSESSYVANVIGLLNASPVDQTKLDKAIATAIAAGGPGMVAALILTAGLGSDGKTPNATMSASMTRAVLAVAQNGDAATQTAIGQGIAAARATLINTGYTSLATSISSLVAAANISAVNSGNTSGVTVVVPSPAQTCSGGSCN